MNEKYDPDPDIRHRRSIRLKGYDYSLAGAYFVTICTQGKVCMFGEVSNGEIVPNDAGRMLLNVLEQLPQRFLTVELDQYMLMPNHLHAVFVLMDVDARRDAVSTSATLGRIIAAYKSLTTNEYIRGVAKRGWQPFAGRLWQRDFYERIIRNERELDAIREYIMYNPAHWVDDENHP